MARGGGLNWLGWIAAAIGLLIVGIPGLWLYMDATALPVHPNPQGVPSVNQRAPASRWAESADRSRQILRAALSENNLPGVSVAVGVGSEIVWAEGFGFADIDARVPVTPSHQFRIGNASAVLTSAAAGLLIEDGRLRLDEPIQTYVPEFPKKQWPVTLRQVMAHVSGLRTDGGDEGPLFSEHCERPVQALPHFSDSDLVFQPGTRYRHSNFDWILVSAAVESATKQPFLTFMQDHVFGPLGMQDTVADTSRADSPVSASPNRAMSYFPRFAAKPTYGADEMRNLDYSCYAGSSVYLSTPSDLVRFAMAINAGRLLEPSTVRLLQESQRLASGEETGYGLGWHLETLTLAGQPVKAVGQDGKLLGGKVASLITFPGNGMAVAVISNISYADTHDIALKIANAFAVR